MTGVGDGSPLPDRLDTDADDARVVPAPAPGPDANGGIRAMADLPASVRARIVEWAADVVGGAAPRDLPATLQKVARFAPAKRARLAGPVLADAVQHDEVFRAMVAEHAARLGTDAPMDMPAATARAVLLRTPGAEDLLAQAAAAQDQAGARARVGELEQELRGLTARLVRAQEQLAAQVATPPIDPGAEAERLKKRLRDQGTRLRELQDLLAAERGQAAAQREALAAELDRARAQAQVWRHRAEAAAGRADAASQTMRRLRESSQDRRAVDDRRLDLLLGVLESAATGLRREWNLIGGGPAPADTIAAAAQLPAPTADRRTTDPARLTMWAGLPGAHLIVDGYNVSKTGYAELVLADQRERLVRHLAAFAARTSAEVTVVFDGAAVATSRPFARGVRVLFSPPGVPADDVIADLVRAEPTGRVVIVISTDGRVAQDAVAAGARSAASSVLLTAMGG